MHDAAETRPWSIYNVTHQVGRRDDTPGRSQRMPGAQTILAETTGLYYPPAPVHALVEFNAATVCIEPNRAALDDL